jgi:hypothetical protein
VSVYIAFGAVAREKNCSRRWRTKPNRFEMVFANAWLALAWMVRIFWLYAFYLFCFLAFAERSPTISVGENTQVPRYGLMNTRIEGQTAVQGAVKPAANFRAVGTARMYYLSPKRSELHQMLPHEPKACTQ